MILSGKEPAAEILSKVKQEITKLERPPLLAIILVGRSEASEVYVRMKIKNAEEVGMKTRLYRMPEESKEKELLDLVERLNKDNEVDGFIVQLPIPKHINVNRVVEAIDPKKDVDGFHIQNMGRLFLGLADENTLLPATPAGIMKMLAYYNIPVEGRNAVVIGRSNIVGKPIALMLLLNDATVTICHSKTKNLAAFTKNADLIIAAAGKPRLITADMVKDGAFVIDVGTTKVGDRIVGDVDYENIVKKASVTPNPGGVGPLTRAMLIYNTMLAAKNRRD